MMRGVRMRMMRRMIMVEMDVLKDLLVEALLGEVTIFNERRCAVLKESGADAKLKRVDIYDIPDGSLLLNLDKYEQPKSLFRDEKGQRQRCDYVLVTKVENRKLLLFIEMKSSKLKNTEIQKQFKGAECVIDYCNAALTRFHDQSDLLKKLEKRFVVFYKPHSIPKRSTRPAAPSSKNDTPEKAYRYASPINPSLKSLVKL